MNRATSVIHRRENDWNQCWKIESALSDTRMSNELDLHAWRQRNSLVMTDTFRIDESRGSMTSELLSAPVGFGVANGKGLHRLSFFAERTKKIYQQLCIDVAVLWLQRMLPLPAKSTRRPEINPSPSNCNSRRNRELSCCRMTSSYPEATSWIEYHWLHLSVHDVSSKALIRREPTKFSLVRVCLFWVRRSSRLITCICKSQRTENWQQS